MLVATSNLNSLCKLVGKGQGEDEEAKDMESDPDLMDDADELYIFCYLLVLIACSRLVFVCQAVSYCVNT